MTNITTVVTFHFPLFSLSVNAAVVGLMSELTTVKAFNASQALIVSLATGALFRPMASASAVEASISGRGLVVLSIVVVIGDSSPRALSGDMSEFAAVVALYGVSLRFLLYVLTCWASVCDVSLFTARVAFLNVVFILEVGALLRKVSLLSTVVALDIGSIRSRAVLGVMSIIATVEALVSGASLVPVSVSV